MIATVAEQGAALAPAVPVRRGSRAGLLAYKALIARKAIDHRRLLWRVRIFLGALALVSGLSAVATRFDDAMGAACVMSLFLLLFSVAFSDTILRLTRDEYRALPGAVDAAGEHACIACGHGEIYRRPVYKTAVVLAGCARCEQPLWASIGDDGTD